MIRIFNFFDRTFGAATYAEANCHEHARDYHQSAPAWGYHESILRGFQLNWKTKLENIFCAVAFAEENCPDKALEFIVNQSISPQKNSLKEFLDVTGLSRVPVYYGTTTLQYAEARS